MGRKYIVVSARIDDEMAAAIAAKGKKNEVIQAALEQYLGLSSSSEIVHASASDLTARLDRIEKQIKSYESYFEEADILIKRAHEDFSPIFEMFEDIQETQAKFRQKQANTLPNFPRGR